MSRPQQSRAEQEAVAYAKRKREEEEDYLKATEADATKGEQLLQQGQSHDLRLALSQKVDLDQIAEVMNASDEQAMNDETLEARRKALAEFERKRVARTIAVPTDDRQVKMELRKHGHPICLFGEDAGDRRSRLRFVLSKMAMGSDRLTKPGEDKDVSMDGESSDDNDDEEEFYTEGSEELRQSRRRIAMFSLERTRKRLDKERKECNEDLAGLRKRRLALAQNLSSYSVCGSQVGDVRPLGRALFTPDSRSILTGSWSGSMMLWSAPDFQPQRTFRGHTDRVSGLSFHPQAGSASVDFASGGADNNVFLWSLKNETPVGQLVGHQGRVVHVDHHPSGDYLGSASYDGSWRLWDIATQKELLLQEGHSREVFALRFQEDGALVATAGLDGIGRVWDLRSGRSIMELTGHAKEIFGLDWSPNCHQLATGSADNTVKIFDLRKLCSIYQIPAHKSMVTDLSFFHANLSSFSENKDKMAVDVSDSLSMDVSADSYAENDSSDMERLRNDGQYLVTASNDGMVNIWSVGDWKLQKSLAGHVGKVLSVDISGDGNYIVSAGYDRTFKLWGPEDF
ncbi:hypothetical protein H4R99_003305 [Coemansia sp. RSA 1722]|nr:hypothetical protein IWW45_006233 [Coemansia sp. RSA 485]KAJ2600545.1 hypothetical protein H4R99_003305 [Coemansia sp. RSA 1722]